MSSYRKCFTSWNFCIKRSFQTNSSTFQSVRTISRNQRQIPIAGYLMLSVPITTFGLGIWQINRKIWKENLLEELHKKTNLATIDFPDNLSELDNLEYRRVRVRGKFDHSRETYLGPRSLLKGGDSQSTGSLMSPGSAGQSGYYVITPFVLSDRNLEILVNRGFVSNKKQNPNTRLEGQISHEITIEGIVRHTEPRPTFVPKHTHGNVWSYRDLESMSSKLGTSPIFLDCCLDSSVPGGPIGGQTRITLRNEHLSYILTWFGISAGSSYLWWKNFVRR